MLYTEDFNYDLPSELIAQKPLSQRDECKLLSIDRYNGECSHLIFKDICKLLKKGDRLVLNDTKVIPARIFGVKENGVPIEFLFTEVIDEYTWKVIAKPAKRLKVGTVVTLSVNNSHKLIIKDVLTDGSRIVQLIDQSVTLESILEQFGHFPLPHYITREDDECDRDDYQTVYARKKGAIACPTAGLHFTKQLIDRVKAGGIEVSYVTLHVGIGTFRPVKTDDPTKHDIHEEYFELSEDTAKEIVDTKNKGGRIIAVGTTVVRVLEHCANISGGSLCKQNGRTKLMILPPYNFQIIDGLITNFHLPKSTLLMLVSAFAGREHILNAYSEAIKQKYRFFSYGDAMAIL